MHLSCEFGLPTMTNCHLGNCTGGQSSQGSLSSDLGRKGTHTKVYKFPVKLYPILGYYGCTGKIGMVSHPENHQFYKGLRLMPQHFHHQKSSGVQEHMSKHFSRMTHHSKVFITISPSIPI